TIARADVAPDFKAPYADSAVHADTADYAQMASDSARVAANAYLLQGKDTIALWNAKTLQGKDSTGFVNAGQVSSVTSAMITDAAVTTVKIKDSTIARADVAPDFKAPYADSAVHADTADYAQMASDSARVAANAYLLQGKDTTALNASYVNKGQPNSITGAMITDGQVSSADIRDTTVNTTKLKDNAVISAKIADLNVTQAKIAANAVNTTKVERNANSGYVLTSNGGSSDPSWQAVPAVPNHLGDITGPHSATVIAANAVNSGKIADGTVTSADVRDTTVNTAQLKDAAVTAPKLNQMGAGTGQVMKWAGSAWAPRNDSTIPSGNAGGGLTGTYPNPTIAGDAVSSANIVDGSVTSADIRDTTVTLGKIARGSTSGKAIIARGTDSDPAWGYPAAVGDSGTRVAFIKTGTFNFNLGTIPRNSVCDTFVAISGLRPNDRVFLSHPITGNGSAWPHIQGLGSSEVTGDDTLRFRVWNSDPDTDWNPTLNTWRYIWIRQ
ncbi:MAG: hypothetical protein NTX53_19950, partial [candidate division WOR-3 bacterium]|nr:hypothetical protein [candidate division WOR-3 bacterium]